MRVKVSHLKFYTGRARRPKPLVGPGRSLFRLPRFLHRPPSAAWQQQQRFDAEGGMARRRASRIFHRRGRDERFAGAIGGFAFGVTGAFVVMAFLSATPEPRSSPTAGIATGQSRPERLAGRQDATPLPATVAANLDEAAPGGSPSAVSAAEPLPTGSRMAIGDGGTGTPALPVVREGPGEPIPLGPAAAPSSVAAPIGPPVPVLPPGPAPALRTTDRLTSEPSSVTGSRAAQTIAPSANRDASAGAAGARLAPPASGARVFVHYARLRPADRQVAFALADYLQSHGYAVADVRAVDHVIRTGSIRYFFDHDREASEQVLNAVRQFFARSGLDRPPARSSDFTGYAPKPALGTIEVWVPGP